MEKYINENCNVCDKSNIKRISKINSLNNKDKINWIHDSIFELCDLKKTEIYMGFCLNCFHGCIFPKFDTNKLYEGNKEIVHVGYLARKKIYEDYFPDKSFDNYQQLSFSKVNKVKNEFKRISNITRELLIKHISLNSLDNNREINILDWGAGDGYMSRLIKIILESLYDIKVNIYIYDISKWNKLTNQKILNKKYDFVLLSHVLEHVHDLQTLMDSIKKNIHINSSIIIEVPDERIQIIKSFFFRKKIFLDYHVNYFTKNSLIHLFGRFGLFGNFSYIKSSYRGNNNLSIFGIVNPTENKKYYKINEISNLFFYIISNLFFYIIRKIFYIIRKIYLKITDF